MSTDAQPPSPKEAISSPSSTAQRPSREKRKPPAAFHNETSSSKHKRSASFSGLVSRILPSRRAEKGYTRRSSFNEDSVLNAAVASNAADQVPNNSPESTEKDGGKTRLTRSWSPRKATPQQRRPTGLKKLFGSTKTEASDTTTAAEQQVAPSQQLGIQGEEQTTTAPSDPWQLLDALRITGKGTSGEALTASTAQQMFDDKKIRREQRRSLRDSGDYIGVQGANPRTGYWDVSDATSSSDPSQMSEEARKKLDQQAQEISEQKKKYEDAQEQFKTELERVQSLRSQKKKEKAERKKVELKIRQRRQGKWKLSETGWSSVAEPELSPIVQSLVGSPTREVPPDDRLFPMPSAAYPAPYQSLNMTHPAGYFPQSLPQPIESANHKGKNVVRTSSVAEYHSIQRKPVGSPARREEQKSTDTVLHTDNELPRSRSRTPASSPPAGPSVVFLADSAQNSLRPDSKNAPQDNASPESFLGPKDLSLELDDPFTREATAILYQSGSTRQVLIRPRSVQSQEAPKLDKAIMSLQDLPPVNLKEPYLLRSLPNSQQMKPSLPVWEPPTIIHTTPDTPKLSINTSTTITTGIDHLLPQPAQFDGPLDEEPVVRARVPSLQHKLGRIHLRNSSLPNASKKAGLKTESPTHPADTVISSEHLLGSMRQRTARLCHTTSPVKTELKNIPTSTSTSQQIPAKPIKPAQNAAQVAFNTLTGNLIGAPQTGQQENKLSTFPKTNRTREGETRNVVEAERDRGILDLTRKHGKDSPDRGKSHSDAVKTISPRRSLDRLVVWHSEPSPHRIRKVAGQILSPILPNKAPPKGKGPSQLLAVGATLVEIFQKVWMFVEPVFDSHSSIRKRFQQQRLTWSDKGLFLAAGLFLVGVILIAIAFARVLGMALVILKAIGGIFKALTGV